MRNSLVLGVACLVALSACSGGDDYGINNDVNHIPTCQQQSDWARLGKVPSGEIAISCPQHGIGDYQ